MWSFYHSARKVNESRPGVRSVDGDSQYRIASVSKTFTVLALLYQHAAGNLHLDDPVTRYIPEFAAKDAGDLPWHDITLRILASQLSGLPREFALLDIITLIEDPTSIGLPPASRDVLPPCLQNSSVVCSREELFNQVKNLKPLFAPNQKSTYSNLNYDVLGIVLENVTGKKFSEYIKDAIFGPLDMTFSSLKTPGDKHAVLPEGEHWWDRDLGVQSPTGGVYSSATDLSKYLRYILTHYNALATGVNWFNPASFATGPASFYGMPWEIFRTTKALPDGRRPVTFVNKGGSLPGHYSMITLLPDYDLGITVLTAGRSELLNTLLDLISASIIRAAEDVIWRHVEKTYVGEYVSQSLNSSVSLTANSSSGLVLDSFISNGTDVLHELIPGFFEAFLPKGGYKALLVPTLLYKNESAQTGEIFRVLVVSTASPSDDDSIWSRECVTDVDLPGNYANLPVNELVFWHDEGIVELPAWKAVLHRHKEGTGAMSNLQRPLLAIKNSLFG